MISKFHSRRGAFTLVEIMIVVAIIALLAAIAVPNFLRARKRSQATRVLEDLRLIDAAVDQYAIEANLIGGAPVTWTKIKGYLKVGSNLYASGGADLLKNSYGPDQVVDQLPSVPALTYTALSDVAPAEFWSPFRVLNP